MNSNLALAELRAEPHISCSALTTYTTCSRKYELSYLRNVPPTHRPGALSFGSAVHSALAFFYTSLRSAKSAPSKKVLADMFIKAWRDQLKGPVPTLLDDGQTENEVEKSGVALLETFYDLAPKPHRVIDIELPFSIELVNPDTGEILPERLVGVFDAIVQEPDGRYTILEHKTSSRRWGEDKLAFDQQLTAYSLAAPAMGLGDAGISVQLLLKTKKPALEIYRPIRTDDDRRDFLRMASGVLKAIEAGAFYPLRGWGCRSCSFAGVCVAG